MVLTISAYVGFFTLILADLAAVKGKKGLFPALQASGYILVAASIAGIAFFRPSDGYSGPSAPARIFAQEPSFLPSLCVLCIVVFGALTVWSVFLEIPMAKRRGTLNKESAYMSGTYSLCRHPGFWWLAFFLLALGVLRNYSENFVTILSIIALNLLLTFLQDHYIFPKVLRGYSDYKKKVPFLLPKF